MERLIILVGRPNIWVFDKSAVLCLSSARLVGLWNWPWGDPRGDKVKKIANVILSNKKVEQ